MLRINYDQLAPEGVSKLAAVTPYLEASSLEPLLRAFVEIRVSQINGCVYCVDLHAQQARRLGETQQRLDMLPVWPEAPYFDERERAALTWAPALTYVSTTRALDADYCHRCDECLEQDRDWIEKDARLGFRRSGHFDRCL